MKAPDLQRLSRRAVLMAAAGLTCGGGAVAVQAATAGSAEDPRDSAVGQAKVNATLDGSPAFWVYSGFIYAVRPQMRPLPLLAISGVQANWAARQPDGSYHLAAPLLSYFRDLDNGDYLDAFSNPITHVRNPVRPNFFGGKGFAVYPADGSAMRLSGQIGASESAPRGFRPAEATVGVGRVVWSETRDTVVLNTDQFFDVYRQPQGEVQTRTADRAGFFDPSVVRLPARFSATTISPWLAWMEMGKVQGHLVWHTSGEKVFSIDEVPAAYRAHAGRLFDALTTRPAGISMRLDRSPVSPAT